MIFFHKQIGFALILLLLVSLASCSRINAYFKATNNFDRLESDKRIFYETNAKDLALQVSNILESAIKKVEADQHCPFSKPVHIYICETEESFAQFTGLNQKIKAAVFKDKIFLSTGLRKQPGRIERLTIHELSHLNIIQQIGTSKFARNIPSWFSEGLAVYVSDGGGAEDVSESDAAHSILAEQSFYPDCSGRLLLPPKTASSYKLKPHMFYRQSAMFVQFMHGAEPVKFKQFLLSIYNNKQFDRSFKSAYGVSIEVYWEKFKGNLTRHFFNEDKEKFQSNKI